MDLAGETLTQRLGVVGLEGGGRRYTAPYAVV